MQAHHWSSRNNGGILELTCWCDNPTTYPTDFGDVCDWCDEYTVGDSKN